MIIHSAEYIISSSDHRGCPKPDKPEYAFIGRSNVGKSSLINMLTRRKQLARISGKPGKTRLINHFLINDEWYLVDLPGYGYASVSKKERESWEPMIKHYLERRPNLMSTFLLIDLRIPPQKKDLQMLDWFGEKALPVVLLFTKSDKLTVNKVRAQVKQYFDAIRNKWEEPPPSIVTSALSGTGKEEILEYIGKTNLLYDPSVMPG